MIPLLALLGFVFVLGFVTWLKVRNLVEVTQWAATNMDAPVRRLGVECTVVALGFAGVLLAAGIEAQGAFAVAALCGMGGMVALLGALGMEGVLGERESQTAQRIAEGRPPPSTSRGRAIAIIAGLVPILASAWWLR